VLINNKIEYTLSIFNYWINDSIIESFEYWNIGVLEYWSIGILEYWNIGVLEY